MLDGRNTLVTIVQSSTVELFQNFGIAVAPMPTMKSLPAGLEEQLSAAATFSGAAMSGFLALFVPHGIHSVARHPEQRPFDAADWTRELCNQLLGRIRNRLHACEIDLRTGMPSRVSGTLLDRHRKGPPPEDMFGFRSMRGNITVTLTGKIDYLRIVYSSSDRAAHEGDVLIF